MTKFDKYPKTELYSVVDTIGHPHMFCIGTKHVVHAADHFNGVLTKDSIRNLESLTGKPSCTHTGCNLMCDEHEVMLVIEVKFKGDLPNAPGLQEYLQAITDQAREDNIAGYAFRQVEGKNE